MADTILPAGIFDDDPFVTNMLGALGWVLDKAIDPLKVQRAWEQLITAWPLLVARLRRDEKVWSLEYAVKPSISLKVRRNFGNTTSQASLLSQEALLPFT